MITKDILSINPDIVCSIIEKTRSIHAKEEVTFDEKIPDSEYEYDWSQVLADHGDDLTYQEIKKTIEDLEPDQQIDILALMYIGRGDYDVDEWHFARQEAKDNIAPNLTGYLLSKPMVSDYLQRGLELLNASCD